MALNMLRPADMQDTYIKQQEEKAPIIEAFRLRRMFKMRDPYPVILARNWSRDMATLECLLFAGCLIVLASVTLTDSTDAVAELLKDDDSINVLGTDLTGEVTLKQECVVVLPSSFARGRLPGPPLSNRKTLTPLPMFPFPHPPRAPSLSGWTGRPSRWRRSSTRACSCSSRFSP
jgi:hypothetical protein